MNEKELCSLIENNIYSGIGGVEGEISNDRQVIYDRYMGELYGNEREGSSKITTREVFETIEWAMPSLVRPFESGDRVIEFDATGPEDEQAAEQETDAVNHVYRKDNNGFVITHNVIKSALLNPNSYVKVWRDEEDRVEKEKYKNLTDNELAMVVNDDEIEVTEQEKNEQGLWDIEITRTYIRGRNRVDTIAEEDIVVHHNHAELTLDDCEFVAHKNDLTHSYLLGLGYDEDELDEAHIEDEYTSEEANRRFYTDENYYNDSEDDQHKAMRHYTVWECYMLLDWDEDGIAELRKVVKIGYKIFENEEIDYMPIVAGCSILMPHKHTGVSVAQSIIDLQDLKTYFMRQVVTNMGRANNPRTLITQGANLTDVLSNRSNGVIRVKQATDVTTEQVQPIIAQAIPLLELIDNQKEARTGITRNSMGLDADVLAKSTEGAFMGAIEKADQRIEFITRVMAETVFKDIFLKLHHLILSGGDTKWMKLNGQWVEVNPAEWKKREAMTINIGLGTGNRREKMNAAQILVADHDKLMAGGMAGTLISAQNVYNGRRLLTESLGEKNVDKYYINPELAPPKQPEPPQPDPNIMMIQSNERIEMNKLQMKMQEGQIQMQKDVAELQFKRAESQRKDELDQIALEYKGEIEGLKASIASSKNTNDKSSKDAAIRIDLLEAQLSDAQNDEKLAMDKYKAELAAGTQITLKRMDAKEAEHEDSRVVGENEILIQTALSEAAKVISSMNQPKEIVRDENGSPIGIRNVGTGETRTIVKGDDGLPTGIE